MGGIGGQTYGVFNESKDTTNAAANALSPDLKLGWNLSNRDRELTTHTVEFTIALTNSISRSVLITVE